MKPITIEVTRYECETCKNCYVIPRHAQQCEHRHQMMDKLKKNIGKNIQWIDDGYRESGILQATDIQDQYIFILNDKGERLRISPFNIRSLDGKPFTMEIA